ncbi:Trigger factor/SurA domain [Cinara cedri]|uniref:Trigger factor/SurA domain n=1 Tax=Cinara cedri TaxID=506608 RepID=A0A5E4MI23_9HEMI|nr:Trigger factor/SurA domain [Cinara cedri]
MHRIVILLLVILPLKLFAINIEIIADVNGEPISNLDIEKRIKLITSLYGNQNINLREVKSQVLKQLVDEVIIANESQRLNIKLSEEEVNNSIVSFFMQSFELRAEEVNQYIKKHDIDLKELSNQIKYQLLWNKIIENRIVSFINGVSDEEVNNSIRQIEKSDYLIKFEKIIVNQKATKDIVKKLYNDGNSTTQSAMVIDHATVSLNQSKGVLKDVLRKSKIDEITDYNEGPYSFIRVNDKIQLDHGILNSTLNLKQIIVKDSESVLKNLKKKKVNCSNFNKLTHDLKLPNIKELKIKMRDLNPELQILFHKTNINEILEIKESSAARLIMLCNIESDKIDIEAIKQGIYQQKIIKQSSMLFDEIRKNAIVNYHKNGK